MYRMTERFLEKLFFDFGKSFQHCEKFFMRIAKSFLSKLIHKFVKTFSVTTAKLMNEMLICLADIAARRTS